MSTSCQLSFQQQALFQQGYQSYTPAELKQLEWGLRFTPSVCALIALYGLIYQLPYLLFGVAILGFWAFFLPAGHPMDLLYNNAVRPLFGAVKLPPNPLQRRLACLSAGVMNIISGILFLAGYPTAALINGGILMVLQAIVIATHFCTLSWMYELLMRALGKWTVPMDLAQAQALLKQGALLVDVRGKDEYDKAHLPNAVNLPLDTLQQHCATLKQQNVLLYCASGMRSHIATELLKKHGVETAHNLGAMERVKAIITP